MSRSSDEIFEEIRRSVGFVPPALLAAADSPEVLENLYVQARTSYLGNPLPAMFKEKFLAVMARWNLSTYCIIVRSCAVSQLGLEADKILELLKTRIPPQTQITEQIRIEAANWPYKSNWASIPRQLEWWVLWAAVRVALAKDPAGRCRNVMREVLGEPIFNSIVLLGTYASTQRAWLDSHPEIDPSGDMRVQACREELLRQAPEISEIWARVHRRGVTGISHPRQKKLLAEIARQDRVRQALRESEKRFRKVVQNVPFPVMVYAGDGGVIMLNKAWTSQSGWTIEDVPTVEQWLAKGQNNENAWEPADIKALYGYSDVIEEGEHRIQTSSGQTRTWDFYTASIGRLADGRHAIMRVAVDVTERTRLEAALWDTNRRVISILEAITDGFIAVDREGKLLYVNRKAQSILKLNRDDMVGKTMGQITGWPANSRLQQAVDCCLEEKATQHIDWYSDRLDAYLEIHLYGSEEGLSCYFRDISQRKRMEQKLRASERRFRGIYEGGMVGMLFADMVSGDVVDCNDAMLRIIGYDRADLEARKINWRTMTPPEYRQLDADAAAAVVHRPIAPYEKQYIRKDGSRVPVLIGGAPIIPGDATVMAFVVDLTDLKAAQLRSEESRRLLNAIVRASIVAIILIDMDGHVTIWNAAAQAMFGWSESEVLGKISPLVPADKMHLFTDLRRRLAAGESIHDMVLPCVTKEHGLRHAQVSLCPVRDASGDILALMAMLTPLSHDEEIVAAAPGSV